MDAEEGGKNYYVLEREFNRVGDAGFEPATSAV